MDTIYLIGQPGSGKSTLAKEFQKDWHKLGQSEQPFKHEVYTTPELGMIYSFGWQREPFGGTDTLGNAVINSVPEFYDVVRKSNVTIFGEGDRLANSRFFDFAQQYGTLYLFYLDTPDALAESRRNERAAKVGKTQNPTWVKGRVTKNKNLACNYSVIRLDGTLTPSANAQIMLNYLSPLLGNA